VSPGSSPDRAIWVVCCALTGRQLRAANCSAWCHRMRLRITSKEIEITTGICCKKIEHVDVILLFLPPACRYCR
jgi:hypothetical protein